MSAKRQSRATPAKSSPDTSCGQVTIGVAAAIWSGVNCRQLSRGLGDPCRPCSQRYFCRHLSLDWPLDRTWWVPALHRGKRRQLQPKR